MMVVGQHCNHLSDHSLQTTCNFGSLVHVRPYRYSLATHLCTFGDDCHQWPTCCCLWWSSTHIRRQRRLSSFLRQVGWGLGVPNGVFIVPHNIQVQNDQQPGTSQHSGTCTFSSVPTNVMTSAGQQHNSASSNKLTSCAHSTQW